MPASPPRTRTPGFMLLMAGGLTFLGTSLHWLPYAAVLPASGSCLLGLWLFMRAHRTAIQQTEHRIRKALEPELRSQALERHAARQAEVDGLAIDRLGSLRKEHLLEQRADFVEVATPEREIRFQDLTQNQAHEKKNISSNDEVILTLDQPTD